MAWIHWVEEHEADGPIAEIYARAHQTFTFVPDVVKVFSLRPPVAVAQEALRRSLLGPASSLGARRADMISTAVSGLNDFGDLDLTPAFGGVLVDYGSGSFFVRNTDIRDVEEGDFLL